MNVVGKIGGTRRVPKPSSDVLNEALNLLVALGGGEDIKKMVAEMKAVQEHNEAVLKQALEATAEANKRTMDAEQAEAEAERARSKGLGEVTTAQEVLKRDTTAAEEAQREAQKRLGGSTARLEKATQETDRRAREQAKGERALQEKTQRLRRQEDELRVREEAVSEREKDVAQAVADLTGPLKRLAIST